MRLRVCMLAALSAGLLSGGESKVPAGKAGNQAVEIDARLYCGKDAVREVLGNDLGGYIVVVDAAVKPKSGEPLPVFLDDFTLRSDKDGQRSQPFKPSQIAGRGALVIGHTGGGAAMMSEDQGPVIGGYPGTGGRPRRLGGDGGAIGNAGSTETHAVMHSGVKEKPDPLLDTLKEKVLPEKETSEPVSGLLYFLMEGKHKPKQLELLYKGAGGKLSLRFEK